MSRALKLKRPEDKIWLSRKEPEKGLRNGMHKDVDTGKHKSFQKRSRA